MLLDSAAVNHAMSRNVFEKDFFSCPIEDSRWERERRVEFRSDRNRGRRFNLCVRMTRIFIRETSAQKCFVKGIITVPRNSLDKGSTTILRTPSPWENCKSN
jgi:hypothetical protein